MSSSQQNDEVQAFLEQNGFTKEGKPIGHSDPYQEPPLNLAAAQAGRADLVEALLKQDGFSEVNAVSRQGQTALHVAASLGHAEIVSALLRSDRFTMADAFDSSKGGYDGQTALHLAVEHAGDLPTVQALLKSARFTAVNAATKLMGETALHLAVRRGDMAIFEALLGSDRFTALDARDNNLQTALHHAALHGSTQAAEALLRCPRFRAGGARAGGYCGMAGHWPVLPLLVGVTAADVAEERGYEETAKAIRKLQRKNAGLFSRVGSGLWGALLVPGHIVWRVVENVKESRRPKLRCGMDDRRSDAFEGLPRSPRSPEAAAGAATDETRR